MRISAEFVNISRRASDAGTAVLHKNRGIHKETRQAETKQQLIDEDDVVLAFYLKAKKAQWTKGSTWQPGNSEANRIDNGL